MFLSHTDVCLSVSLSLPLLLSTINEHVLGRGFKKKFKLKNHQVVIFRKNILTPNLYPPPMDPYKMDLKRKKKHE